MTLLRTAVKNSNQRSTQVASHWRGPRFLNTVVLAMADGLFGLCGWERADELSAGSAFPPLLPSPPSLISPLVSVAAKHHVYVLTYPRPHH